MREWRKRQRSLEEYLCESESDILLGLENPDSDDMPGTPNSSNSDSNPGISDGFDFDTDTDIKYWFTDSENEINDDVKVAVSFEEELRKWAIDHSYTPFTDCTIVHIEKARSAIACRC